MSFHSNNPDNAQAAVEPAAAPRVERSKPISAYAQVGAKLIDQGIVALPVGPGTKVTGEYKYGHWQGMTGWTTRFANSLPSDSEISEFETWPNAGVCVVTGSQSRDIVAIDIDDDRIVDIVLRALPETHVIKRGRKGATAFFRGPGVGKGVINGIGPDGEPTRLVDILGEGGQTVLPPTIHMDTKQPYRWIGEIALEDAHDSDLPLLPTDFAETLEEALRPFGSKSGASQKRKKEPGKSKAASKPKDDESPFDELKRLALANLGAWVKGLGLYGLVESGEGYRAVVSWRPSGSGKQLHKRDRNLSIHPEGINDWSGDGGLSPIDLVMKAKDYDFDQAFAWLSDRLYPKPKFIKSDDDKAGSEQDEARKVWAAAQDPAGTPGETFLREAYSITVDANWPASMRWRASDQSLVFALSDPAGAVAAVHCLSVAGEQRNIGVAGNSAITFPSRSLAPEPAVVITESAVSALAIWAATGIETRAALSPDRFVSVAKTVSLDTRIIIARTDAPSWAGYEYRHAEHAVIDMRDTSYKVACVFPWAEQRNDRSDFASLCAEQGMAAVNQAIISGLSGAGLDTSTFIDAPDVSADTRFGVDQFTRLEISNRRAA